MYNVHVHVIQNVFMPPPPKQKLHNVGVAFSGLSAHMRLPPGVSVEHVVEGHREKTLALLWAVIFHFQVCHSIVRIYAYLHTQMYL